MVASGYYICGYCYYIYGGVGLLHLWLNVITFMVGITFMVVIYIYGWYKGHPAELFLAQLTEIWRKAIDNKLVVGAAFCRFSKSLRQSPSRYIVHKLQHAELWHKRWTAGMAERLPQRWTTIYSSNGGQSNHEEVTYGIPQGSVLDPTLHALYTSDMPTAVTTRTVYLYADGTTVYCIGESIDQVTALLKDALEELNEWCLQNTLTAHRTGRGHTRAKEAN